MVMNTEKVAAADGGAFEVELCVALALVLEEGLQLLGDDREHLDVDSIELIEAAPGTCGGQALEELGHHHVVHLLGAVEHHTLLGQGLARSFTDSVLPVPAGPAGAPPRLRFRAPIRVM